jgi:hypothetical protein
LLTATFDPRADTEVIVEAAVACLRGRKMDASHDFLHRKRCIAARLQTASAQEYAADCSASLAVAKTDVYAKQALPRSPALSDRSNRRAYARQFDFSFQPTIIPTADMDTLMTRKKIRAEAPLTGATA